MKKVNISIITAILLSFTTLFVACKNGVEIESSENTQSYISIKNFGSNFRAVNPTVGLENLDSFVLEGKMETEDSYKVLGTWKSTEEISSAKIPVAKGNWNFKLWAYSKETSLYGTVKKLIENGDNQLNFELEIQDYGQKETGAIKIILPIETDVELYEAEVSLLTFPSKNSVEGIPSVTLSFDTSIDVDGTAFEAMVYENDSIPSGTYFLDYKFSNYYVILRDGVFYREKVVLNDYSVIVVVADGLASTAVLEPITMESNYTMSFETNGGKFTSGYCYPICFGRKSEISLPDAENISKTGYSFGGWYLNKDFSGEAQTNLSYGTVGNKKYYAKWVPETGTEYTVNYYYENIADENYHFEKAVTATGTTDELTTYKAPVIDGFDLQEYQQVCIAPDGSSELNIYYKRKLITIQFDYDDEENISVTRKYGSVYTVNFPVVKTGYTFENWNPAYDDTIPFEDTIYVVQWKANTDTKYTANLYIQNIEDDEYSFSEAIELTGTTDTNTSYEASPVAGFTAQDFEQVNINADGGSVLDVYYKRNIITISFDGDEIKTAKYGTSYVPEIPVKAGYTFSKWIPAYDGTLPSVNIDYKSEFTANVDTKYIVKHFKQTVDCNSYDLVESEVLTGETATMTKAEAKVYTGFTAKTFEQTSILGDETTVVSVYYNRNNIIYTFDLAEGSWSLPITISGVYEAPVEVTEIPVRQGYAFCGWTPRVPDTFGCEDKTFTAKWTTSSVTVDVFADIQVAYEQQEMTYIFTASSGFDSYEWSIDDVVQTETSNKFTIDTSDWGEGVYLIVLVGKKGQEIRSSTLYININE